MKVSICIATCKRPDVLQRTLNSIVSQRIIHEYEVIVVESKLKNPARARNEAYAQASGDIIIAQSDDVIHHSPECINVLVETLLPNSFVIATVYNVNQYGRHVLDNYNLTQYTGKSNQRPLFFLGALWRKDLLAVYGNDEDFVNPGREDVWFGDCLTKGLQLNPIFTPHVVGHHQDHRRILNRLELLQSSQVYKEKREKASQGLIKWEAQKSLLRGNA